jgi:signal transduction histidine kinase
MLCFLCCVSVFSANGQTSLEDLKRSQRAIFIFNFAQQVGWLNMAQLETFSIGVLGTDPVVINLNTMAQKRNIAGKPVKILRFQDIKAISDVQLLYVNRSYGYNITTILEKISQKNILLVTENYDYNKSMINMINVEDTFQYEINIRRLQKENFVIAPSLKSYAISSSDKWKKLYESTRSSLEKKEKDVKEKEAIIEGKDVEIKGIVTQIESRDDLIQELSDQTILQHKKYEEKIKIEGVLEQRIKEQLDVINRQKHTISNYGGEILKTNAEIANQKQTLVTLEQRIKEKEKVLNKKNDVLHTQKQFIGLLVVIVVGILLAVFILYRSFLIQKRLRQQLEVKNREVERLADELMAINTKLYTKNYKINTQAKALASQNDALEQFAYIASHDLQEPLNTISSFIDLLTDEYGERFDEVGKNSLEYINAASIRMKRLINALLEYSRLGRSNDFKPVDCNTLLIDLQADLKHAIESVNATLEIENLPIVTGAEVELRLLFQNLISNAIKFTKPDVTPNIYISCKSVKEDRHDNRSAGYWEFSIKDNGIGIPKAQQDKVFDIFQRLHSRDEYKGTGIGLAHCKKIIESHGGQLWLASQEGVGSTFYFTIPEKS